MRLNTMIFILLDIFLVTSFVGCNSLSINESNNTISNIVTKEEDTSYTLDGTILEININKIEEECDCVLEEDLTKGIIKIQADKDAIVVVINNKTKIFKDNKEIDIKDLQLDDIVVVEFKSFVEDSSINQGIANIINVN